MAEYIKRDYAVDAVLDVYCDTPDIDLSCEKFEAAIRKIQAADVAPVRHGRWEEWDDGFGGTYYHCSVCGEDWCTIDGTPAENGMRYCPQCGARMDGGKDA